MPNIHMPSVHMPRAPSPEKRSIPNHITSKENVKEVTNSVSNSNAELKSSTAGTDQMIRSKTPLKSLEESLNKIDLIDPAALTEQMKNVILGVNLKWLSMPTVSRKTVFEFQNDFNQNILRQLREIIITMSSIAFEGKQIFEQIFNMFDDLNSEHKCIGMLKRYDLLMEPREFLISNELRAGVSQNKQEISNDPVTGLLMPIKFHMKKYLEADNVLETILKYLEPSSDGYIRSLVDGTIWQERVNNLKSNLGAKIVLPLKLFFDDFTTGDTASPHATRTSIFGIYYYIPSLPGYLLAKLANMHVAGFILIEDKKRYANDDLFFSLIDMLIELETDGIEINYRNSTMKINFMLAFITGDNLGLSGVLDLVESVRANFYCRMCKRNRQQRETDCIEH
ncbi:uncharacterized protein LOC129718424 [Wyeomyia smithii]|uniref:uncharacterized protein LOC129718424 n=1 Tax=Wyeomyia smithii TaxID=174621 RepID=UPI002467FA09|nr:uncharacterized protein LOC129718424 [Wyeomyia smithii]